MIRTTTLLDDAAMLKLVKEFYPLTSYSKICPLDDETILELFAVLRRRGLLYVAEDAGQLVGIIAAIGTPFLFNKNFTSGHEIVWWVSPEHRGKYGKDLLRTVDQIAMLKGWKSLQMVRLETSSPVLDRLFKSEGFHPTEYCFTKVY